MAFVWSVPLIVMAGVLIGIVISAPIGPVNVLVIQRTLARGYWSGLATGLGAAAADGMIAAVAAFGLAAVKAELAQHRTQIQLLGALVLIVFGLRLIWVRAAPAAPHEGSPFAGRAGIVLQGFALTITNPGAVLGVFALVTGLGSLVEDLHNYFEAGLLVAAILAGSLAWWVSLAWFIATIRHRIDDGRLRLMNQFAGVLLLGFGAGLMARVALRLAG